MLGGDSSCNEPESIRTFPFQDITASNSQYSKLYPQPVLTLVCRYDAFKDVRSLILRALRTIYTCRRIYIHTRIHISTYLTSDMRKSPATLKLALSTALVSASLVAARCSHDIAARGKAQHQALMAERDAGELFKRQSSPDLASESALTSELSCRHGSN